MSSFKRRYSEAQFPSKPALTEIAGLQKLSIASSREGAAL